MVSDSTDTSRSAGVPPAVASASGARLREAETRRPPLIPGSGGEDGGATSRSSAVALRSACRPRGCRRCGFAGPPCVRDRFLLCRCGRILRHRNLLHHCKRGVCLRAGNKDREASFIRHIQRIQTQNFAGALHRLVDRDQVSSSLMQTFRSPAISFSVVASPPRVRSRRQ